MTHAPSDIVREKRSRSLPLLPGVWPSVAIVAVWLAVLFTGIWGPDIVNDGACRPSGQLAERSDRREAPPC